MSNPQEATENSFGLTSIREFAAVIVLVVFVVGILFGAILARIQEAVRDVL